MSPTVEPKSKLLPMKKTFVLPTLFLIFIVSASLDIIDYNCINLPATPFHYLALSEMPTDIQNTTLPLADTGRNMDNMPFSIGLNGLPNNTTDAGATLGRVLFYDNDLSFNHTVSCASCHIQKFGFSDTARLSRGWNGGLTFRNSMGLDHARFHKGIKMFWDMRASSVEDQATRPILDAVEMGMTNANLNGHAWDSITARLSNKNFYPSLFQSAFGSMLIDSQRIALALAQFVRSINTFGSKWRVAISAPGVGNPAVSPIPAFTAQELLGRDLFMDVNRGNCQSCHTRNIFVPQGAQNNGADGIFMPGSKFVWTPWASRTDYVGKDSLLAGFRNTGTPFIPYPALHWERDTSNVIANIGRAKVPSLINVALTPPYFHDGRYNTLDEVINFYSDSIHNNSYNTLSSFLRDIDPSVPGVPNNVQPANQLAIDTAPVRHRAYTPAEKAALKAFLLTLTDSTLINDPKFSDPFCRSSIVSVQFLDKINAYQYNKGVMVSWTTTSEINSKEFVLQRSSDGFRFYDLNRTPGNGSSSQVHVYQAFDPQPINGTMFYRIKAVSIDNQFSYSDIARIQLVAAAAAPSLYPTPARNMVNIVHAAPNQVVRIIDLMGVTIKRTSLNNGMLFVQDIPPGMYIIALKDSDGHDVNLTLIRQ